MNEERIEFLGNPELASIKPVLEAEILDIFGKLSPSQFRHLFAGQLLQKHLASAFRAANATEGTFWLADFDTGELVPIYNNGEQAGKILSDIRQPLGKGLIGMVFATEQSFCENEVYKNSMHSKGVDQCVNMITTSMIAAPVFFGKKTRGVVSCVRLKADVDSTDPPGFTHEDFRHIQVAADTVEVLIQYRALHVALYGSS